jgi:hypothetical protein
LASSQTPIHLQLPVLLLLLLLVVFLFDLLLLWCMAPAAAAANVAAIAGIVAPVPLLIAHTSLHCSCNLLLCWQILQR